MGWNSDLNIDLNGSWWSGKIPQVEVVDISDRKNNIKSQKTSFGRNKSLWLKQGHMLWSNRGYSWLTVEVGVFCGEFWMLGCEAFGFNLLGKEEWLGWLICQQDIGWLNQGKRGGRAFGKGMMDFVLCFYISKEISNCILTLKSILLFSIVSTTYNCRTHHSCKNKTTF